MLVIAAPSAARGMCDIKVERGTCEVCLEAIPSQMTRCGSCWFVELQATARLGRLAKKKRSRQSEEEEEGSTPSPPEEEEEALSPLDGKRHQPQRCGLCGVAGHKRRTCPKAKP